MAVCRLHEVKMNGAVENKTGVLLPGIERCSCPPAYTGLSCEVSSTWITHRLTLIVCENKHALPYLIFV